MKVAGVFGRLRGGPLSLGDLLSVSYDDVMHDSAEGGPCHTTMCSHFV